MGHLDETIDILEKQQKIAMRFFIIGLFSYFISSVMVTWIFYDFAGALVATTLLTGFAILLVRQGREIYCAFITPQPFVTGHLHGNPIRGDDARNTDVLG